MLKSNEFLRFCLFTLVGGLLLPLYMASFILACYLDVSGIALYLLASGFAYASILALLRMVRFGRRNKEHIKHGGTSLPIPVLPACLFAIFFVLTSALLIDACVWTCKKKSSV